jgi:hypothetical protein
VTDPKKIIIEMQPSITDISNTGKVTVSFNKDVIVPSNYENITQDAIEITLITKKEVKGRMLLPSLSEMAVVNNFTWNIT